MEELLVERITIFEEEDGSRIEMSKYRTNSLAPWIEGLFEVHCGQCGLQIAESPDRMDARVRYLEHEMQHIKEELAAYRAAFHRAARVNPSAGPRAT